MKALMLVQEGAESVAAEELLEILPNCQAKAGHKVVHFDVADRQELVRATYRTLTGIRVMEVIDTQELEDIDDIKPTVSKYTELLKEGDTWAVRCKHDVSCLFTGKEIEEEIGAAIFEHTPAKVKLSGPQVLFLAVCIGKDLYIGVDYAGVDLNKREYKVFSSAHNLSGGTAGSFVRLAGFNSEEVTLDPLCYDGTIAIEMACSGGGMPPMRYKREDLQCTFLPFLPKEETMATIEKVDAEIAEELPGKIIAYGGMLRHLNTSKKTSKIAGVDKLIDLSKVRVDDLDLKFEEGTVDRVITSPPSTSVEMNEKKLRNLYSQLFYQSRYILKKDAILATIGGKEDLLREYAEKEGFTLEKELFLYQGKLKLPVFLFSNASPGQSLD